MKKWIALLAISLVLLGPSLVSAKEKIVAEPDFDDSVIFYAWDTKSNLNAKSFFIGVQDRDAIEILVFLKRIDANGNSRYWIRIDTSNEKKFLQNGYIFIDDVTYPIKQIDQWSRSLITSGRTMTRYPYLPVNFAFYDISEDTMKKIAGADPKAKIILIFERTERPLGIRISKEFQSEITTLLQTTRADYDKYKIKDRETVAKTKADLSVDEPVMTYEQMKNPNRYQP